MKRALLNITFVGIGTALGIFATQFIPSYARSERTPPKIIVDDTPVQRDDTFTSSFAPVIKKTAPSVVTIFASRTVNQRMRGPALLDPWLREFFGDRAPGGSRPRTEEALGSGVIVSADGYILTSNHVVENADDIRIQTPDGRDFKATVIGTDPPTDTAVIKIEGTEFPAVTLANSDKLEVGDVVLAIGNPFNIGQTVTMGIVSAVGRGELGILGPGGYEDFIQTDAAINMGNSGGALIDAQGRLVGINTAILSRTGGNQGVGFAIPINMGRSVMERLIANGKVTRGFLGVGLQPLTPDLAERLNLKGQGGALVAGVEQGFPAEKAGIRPGDLITEFDGKPVADHRQLRLIVAQTSPNAEVEVKVLRNGRDRTFQVTLAELPTERTLSGLMRPEAQPAPKNETLEGVEVTDIDSRARRQFNIPNHVQGALVTSVDPQSPAAEEGLMPGDVILEIERETVTGADQAVELSDKFEGRKILLRVWSRGSTKYVFVNVNQPEPEQDEEESPEGR